MAVTVDCGEGKHQLCVGRGRTAYLFPQESKDAGEEPFYCGCGCHHDGTEGCVPCSDPVHAASGPKEDDRG